MASEEDCSKIQLFLLCFEATEYVMPDTVSIERVEALVGK